MIYDGKNEISLKISLEAERKHVKRERKLKLPCTLYSCNKNWSIVEKNYTNFWLSGNNNVSWLINHIVLGIQTNNTQQSNCMKIVIQKEKKKEQNEIKRKPNLSTAVYLDIYLKTLSIRIPCFVQTTWDFGMIIICIN